ncbi:lactadherin-like [Stylophora pistillata]|uniref:lactadherin-like n=1 Tax=Stylophora pistillata TaxID=50429 RepID=UPI000C055E72|nr:lactadherin-like [Stylophora pistillata]
MKSLQVLFCPLILLYITAGFITPFTAGSCTSGKCFATFRFVIGKDMVDGHALLGHVFANVSVIGVKGCYRACQTNCRCISFNFMTHSYQENCQLNEENRHIKPSALRAVASSQYYDLVVRYNIAGNSVASSSSCPQCSNSCCRNRQCLNGGTCQENCQENGKRFICDCSGFIGQICEQECQDALGMENRAITDGQISASSRWSHRHDASNARLHNRASADGDGIWEPATKNTNQWLQIDLVTQHSVTRVATQGRDDRSHWVTKYQLQYSNDGSTFQYHRERGKHINKEFSGNRDASSVVSNYLIPPITARYIRFRPLAWHWQIAMRVELYGCHDCNRTLGMESRAILDGQISASSQYSIYHGAIYARLHNEAVQNVHNEAWEPSTTDANQWLQIDLVTQYGVTRVATQGRYQLTHWVTKYNLLYGNDGSTLQYYRERGQNITEFSGNTDGTTVVSHDLIPPIAARYIRFQPLAWHWHIAMRVELYGCRGI